MQSLLAKREQLSGGHPRPCPCPCLCVFDGLFDVDDCPGGDSAATEVLVGAVLGEALRLLVLLRRGPTG